MEAQLPYRGAPFPSKWRRNHPRSKNGCLTCRSKRKKCDEVRPICTGCIRSNLECTWPTPDKSQAEEQLSSQIDGVLNVNDPNQRLIDTVATLSAGLMFSQGGTTAPLPIRVAPTYGNLAYLSDSSRPLYQQYLDFTAEQLTRGPSEDGNPFVNYLLPLAASNELVLDCVLAIGGAHLTVNDPTDRGLEVATRGHYAKILAGLQKLLAYETNHLATGMIDGTTSTRSSQILLILQLLCFYEVSQLPQPSTSYLLILLSICKTILVAQRPVDPGPATATPPPAHRS